MASLGHLALGMAAGRAFADHAQPARRTHGRLDMLTDGGLGVAVPIPAAPIGCALVPARGFYVLAVEALYFPPVLLYTFLPRRSAAPVS